MDAANLSIVESGGPADVVPGWVPVGLRGATTDPGRRGAVTLVAVALLAALAVAVYVWHSRPQAESIAPPSVVSGGASAGTAFTSCVAAS